MRMRSRGAGLLLALLAVGLGGCASLASLTPKPKYAINDPIVSVVVGYFDVTEMPSPFESVAFENSEGVVEYTTLSTKKGAFWHFAVGPGYHRVKYFTGTKTGLGQTAHIYNFGPRGGSHDVAVTTTTPGVYFLGSHKYFHRESETSKTGSFKIVPTKTPSEKEVLQIVISDMEERKYAHHYPRQYEMIKKRIAQLR